MRLWTCLVVAAVSAAAGSAAAFAVESSGTSAAVREFNLREGDYVYLRKLDLQCRYGRASRFAGPQLQFDCGRLSTEWTGVRVQVTSRAAELSRWEEVAGWTVLAKVRRNP
jgi:hypothetical protein